MENANYLGIFVLLIAVWILSVTLPSFHYSPSTDAERSDNKYIAIILAFGVVFLLTSFPLMLLKKSTNTDQAAAVNVAAGIIGIVGFIGCIVIIVLIVQRYSLFSSGQSSLTYVYDTQTVTNPDGSVTEMRTRRSIEVPPQAGYEKLNNAFLGQKANLSLIGVVILMVICCVWSGQVVNPGRGMFG